MHDERWKIWLAVIAFLVFIRLVRSVFRSMTGAKAGAKTGDGMARLNAAAERILKQKSGGNPVPRTNAATAPATTTAGKPKPRTQVYNAKGITKATPVQARSNPAVIRRGGLLAGREPVIQRRR